jgi:competence ComEA-like helix-hairpin-helix protein
MKHARVSSISIVICGIFAFTLLVAGPSGQSAEQQPAGAAASHDDPAAGQFRQTCGECHDEARIVSTRRTKPEWEQIIHKMIEGGAKGTPKDFETVFGYLLRHHGKVYINSATPDELVTIVGLSVRDAEAIAAARKTNGPFADLEAVKKVPDIDVKKLEEHKDAVAF